VKAIWLTGLLLLVTAAYASDNCTDDLGCYAAYGPGYACGNGECRVVVVCVTGEDCKERYDSPLDWRCSEQGWCLPPICKGAKGPECQGYLTEFECVNHYAYFSGLGNANHQCAWVGEQCLIWKAQCVEVSIDMVLDAIQQWSIGEKSLQEVIELIQSYKNAN
jgi:hypothetical protein